MQQRLMALLSAALDCRLKVAKGGVGITGGEDLASPLGVT